MPNFASTQMEDTFYMGLAEGSRQLLRGRSFKPAKVAAVAGSTALSAYTIQAQVNTLLAGFTGETMVSSIIGDSLTVGSMLYLLDMMGIISKANAEQETGARRGRDAGWTRSFMLAGTDRVIAEGEKYLYNVVLGYKSNGSTTDV